MRPVNHIVIHCSDSPNGRDDRADDIRRWHTDPPPAGRGWHRPGYHFVVCVDGIIEQLVHVNSDQYIEPSEIANGVRGYNSNSVHICMIGTDKFTQAQWDALHTLLADCARSWPDAALVGHRDLDAHKTCPNIDVTHYTENPAAEIAAHLLEVKGVNNG